MNRAKHYLPCVAFVALAFSAPRVAFAQSPAAPTDAPPASRTTAQAAAEALFEDGRRLMTDGKIDQACPKLAESQRLDPGGGTVINLALCHEAQGRVATAWAEFNEALSWAIKDHRENREKLAREHIAKLQPELNHLAVTPAENAKVAGLVVRIDGVVLGEASWGTPTPVDAGEHVIEASAPLHWDAKWTVTVERAKKEQVDFEVPLLLEKPPEALPPGPGVEVPSMSPARRAVMISSFAVAGVGILGGSLFGVLALSKANSVNTLCSDNKVCNGPNGDGALAVHDNNVGVTYSWISTAAFGTAAVGAILGSYLLFVRPSSHGARPPGSALQVVPLVGQANGVAVLSAW